MSMHEDDMEQLHSSVCALLDANNLDQLREVVDTEAFVDLAQACSYRTRPAPDYAVGVSGLSYGQLRMLDAVTDHSEPICPAVPRVVVRSTERAYRFSVVIGVYNSADYLPALLYSLQAQDFADVEYIFIDDGSSDSSAAIVRSWASERQNVTLVSLGRNVGAAAARNAGLDFARGEWVTVVDSDDVLDPHYFTQVAGFMDKYPGCAMYTTRILRLNGKNGEVGDSLPLGFKYRSGDQVVDLGDQPTHIQLGATAFLKRAILEGLGLRYDRRVRPTFEDGHLICRYLLGCTASAERVQVGEVASALYFYRSRTDTSSLVQSGWGIGERYDDQVRFGYLALLQQAVTQCGAVPAWLANTVLYDISWYFTEDITTRARTMWLYHQAELKAQFLELLDAIFALLPPGTDPCRPVSSTVRDAWAVKYWGKPPTGDFCQHFFDEPFAHVTYEREPRVPKGTNPLTWAERMRLRRLVTGDNRAVNLAKAVSRKARHLVKKSAKLKAQVIVNIPWAPASLKGAWVITDRVTGAGDNGEHLYRWIVDNTDQKRFLFSNVAPLGGTV